MRKFAKLFDLKDNQVLVRKEEEFDEDLNQEVFKVAQITELEGGEISLALVFTNDESRDECFEDYNEEHAQLFIDYIVNQLLKAEDEDPAGDDLPF